MIMARLQANQVHAFVDLTDIESANELHRPVDISMPPGVTLVSVEPPEVGVIVPPPHNKNHERTQKNLWHRRRPRHGQR